MLLALGLFVGCGDGTRDVRSEGLAPVAGSGEATLEVQGPRPSVRQLLQPCREDMLGGSGAETRCTFVMVNKGGEGCGRLVKPEAQLRIRVFGEPEEVLVEHLAGARSRTLTGAARAQAIDGADLSIDLPGEAGPCGLHLMKPDGYAPLRLTSNFVEGDFVEGDFVERAGLERLVVREMLPKVWDQIFKGQSEVTVVSPGSKLHGATMTSLSTGTLSVGSCSSARCRFVGSPCDARRLRCVVDGGRYFFMKPGAKGLVFGFAKGGEDLCGGPAD